ncbi:MAG: hypothetical protein R3C19_06780 [Planctomycetaceae bacterium]
MNDNDAGMIDVALVREQTTRVRDLSGFRKGHQVPAEASDRASAFVARIAAADLSRDLDEHFAQFRRQFRFRRTELQVSDPENGAARISTPWFDYRVSVTLDSTKTSQAIWRRQVSEFRSPEQLFSGEFASVFGQSFDTVEFTPPAMIDLEAFIDHVEDRDDNSLTIEYDRRSTWCELSIDEIPARMVVRSDLVSLIARQPQIPAQLLESFLAMRKRLKGIECF